MSRLLLLFFFSFSFFAPVFSRETKDNAALVYLNIWNELPHVDWLKLESDYQDVRKNLWNNKYQNLETLFQENKKIFSQFKKAASMDYCDFFENVDTTKTAEYDLPVSMDQFKTFFRLIILNIKKLEALNKSPEAFEYALGLLKFSFQISSGPTPPSFPIYGKGLLIRKELFEYFSAAEEKNQIIKDNINIIENYIFKTYTMKNIIEFEFALIIRKLHELFENEKEIAVFLNAHNIDPVLSKADILNEAEANLKKLYQRWINAAEKENIAEFQNIGQEVSSKYPESYGEKLDNIEQASKAVIAVSVLPWQSSFENDSNVRLKYKQLISKYQKEIN